MVKLNIRELLCDHIDNFIPHNHSISLGVGLGDVGELLARSRLSQLESKSCDSLHPDTSEDGDFCSNQTVRTSSNCAICASTYLLQPHGCNHCGIVHRDPRTRPPSSLGQLPSQADQACSCGGVIRYREEHEFVYGDARLYKC